ncbi:MAG: fibronectin type III domain-containing protein, partial [Solirubrobacteraceae bacterium]|nr:fibronectin type III domain-containing protein [Patulibacter sp.]
VPPRAASPTNAKLAANGSTTVGISWSTPNPDVCHTTPTGYTVTVGDQTRTVSGSFTSAAQVSGLTPNTPYTASITSLPSSTVQPESPATVSFTTTPGSDTTPPTKPVILSAGHTDPAGNTTVTWSPSTDDTGVVAYDVHAGTLASAPIATVAGIATSVSAHVGVITSGGTQVWVVARDADGNATASDPVGVNTCGMLPSGTLSVDSSTATGVTSTGATVSWTAAGQPGCRPALDHWLVQRSSGAGAPVAVGTIPAGQTTIAASGLTPATTYTFTITGVLADGSTTDPSAASTLTVVTLPDTSGPTTYGFIAAGSATLKNLVKGSVPLSGVFNTTAASDGSFTGQLGLAPATASLKALGFLPVTATVSFVSVGDVTGTSTATSLSAVANERIKLPSIKSFGIQLAGGASCQATQVSKIALSSTGAFTWATGGSVAGTFSISNLSGCGALNGIVSSLTAGGGNAIALTLRPTATPPAPTV